VGKIGEEERVGTVKVIGREPEPTQTEPDERSVSEIFYEGEGDADGEISGAFDRVAESGERGENLIEFHGLVESGIARRGKICKMIRISNGWPRMFKTKVSARTKPSH
jgi:hypothetical protein